ncbi:MAG TPA: NAD(P)-dependent alcohol dehydrogenase [Micromonosporaceae bacterium]|nr:NAD(P)-dependent alcohol dehydrogenase [Micromonosporaceae bacterium]
MKAVVQPAYGPPDVLELRDVPTPVPGDDEVLIRVRAAGVNPQDWHLITGVPYIARLGGGLFTPKQQHPGTDVAGDVAAVGANVTTFQPGDAVFGMRRGAFAEYLCARADRVVAKPANVTYEQAAAVPVAALTALQALRDKGGIQAGQRVLINGASGGVGTFAVQIAKSFDAEVTGVCSTRNVAAARSLGADHVIDYTREDFVGVGAPYDLILDIVGTRSIRDRRRALTPHGTLVIVGGPMGNRFIGPLGGLVTVTVASRLGSQRLVGMLAKNNVDDLRLLASLMATGKVTPLIERTYPLSEASEAVAYVGAKHAQAKIVIVP